MPIKTWGKMQCTDGHILCWIESHPGLATWLQAIFSVVAIYFAGKFARQQILQAKAQVGQSRRHIEAQRINVVHVLIRPILLVAKHIQPRFQQHPTEAILETGLAHFNDYKGALQSLPLFDIPDARLIVYVTTVIRAIEEFVDKCNETKPLIQAETRAGLNDVLRGDKVRELERRAVVLLGNLISQAEKATERCEEFAVENKFRLHQSAGAP